MTKNISILGSTGSIGTSTLDLVRRHSNRLRVVALCGGSNVEVLAKQAQEFSPLLISVKNEKDRKTLQDLLPHFTGQIVSGTDGAVLAATLPEAHTVVSAIVGAAGLLPTMAALEAGKSVALANKESMVIAGEIMVEAAKRGGARIFPVDSEHSALFQCLEGQRRADVSELILTASGGPFLHTPLSEFSSITKERALKHPTWQMGPKITIDSATMMNKGLEVMEARWLFDCPVDKIRVCIHPQSLIHSMVAYKDGSVLAHVGNPDMRVPIAYALCHPERVETGVAPLNLAQIGSLTFFEPDLEKFSCLRLAYEVARKGDTYPSVLNGANEVAVDAFLKDQIPFVAIPKLLQSVLEAHVPKPLKGLEDVLAADRWAREACESIQRKGSFLKS